MDVFAMQQDLTSALATILRAVRRGDIASVQDAIPALQRVQDEINAECATVPEWIERLAAR